MQLNMADYGGAFGAQSQSENAHKLLFLLKKKSSFTAEFKFSPMKI